MVAVIVEKLAEAFGAVFLHYAAEHVVTDKKAFASALSHSTVFRGRNLRVSMAQLLSIKIDDKHLVIQSKRRPQLTPIGGVVRYFPSESPCLEGTVRFRPEVTKGDEEYDLRGFLKGKDFSHFLRWYASGVGREHLALAREIEEEFIEIGIPKISDYVKRPEFVAIRAIHEGPYEVKNESYWQYRYFEILALEEQSDVSKELAAFIRSQSGKNPKLVLVATGEIKKGRTETGTHIIGDSCGYLFSDQAHGVRPPPLF